MNERLVYLHLLCDEAYLHSRSCLKYEWNDRACKAMLALLDQPLGSDPLFLPIRDLVRVLVESKHADREEWNCSALLNELDLIAERIREAGGRITQQ